MLNTLALNVVTCGRCGRAFGHELNVEELTCPYCRLNDDISSFPDFLYPPEHKDSIVRIKF